MVSRRQMMVWSLTLVLHAIAPASGASAEPWSGAYVRARSDEAFAAVPAAPDGTKSRYLHHDATGGLDPSHVRSALTRLGQVCWDDPADAVRARRHLVARQKTLGVRRRAAPPPAGGRSR